MVLEMDTNEATAIGLHDLKNGIRYSKVISAQTDLPKLKSFYEQFKTIARNLPNKVAINDKPEILTYEKLCIKIELLVANL